jgi:streptogramin lyase
VRHGSLGRLRQGANKVKIDIPRLAAANQAIVLHTGDGSVWAGILTRNLQQDAIQRIDPNGTGTAKLVGTIPVHSGLIDFGIDSGTLWILDQRDMLQGVHLKTVKTGATVHEQITDDPQHIAVGDGAVYITRAASNTLLEVNPFTLKKTVLGTTGAFPTALAVHGRDIWVLGQNDGTVTHFDRDDGRVGEPMPVCPNPYAVAADAKGAWIACVNGWVVRVTAPSG